MKRWKRAAAASQSQAGCVSGASRIEAGPGGSSSTACRAGLAAPEEAPADGLQQQRPPWPSTPSPATLPLPLPLHISASPAPPNPASPAPLPPLPSSPRSERGRPGGRAPGVFATAPHASHPSKVPVAAAAASASAASADAPSSALPLSHHPVRPSNHLAAAAAAEALNPSTQPYIRPLPFKSRSPRRRRLSSARLWNPTNSTPRTPSRSRTRARRTSSPPAPAVPLQHPALDQAAHCPSGDYPLLSLSQQRQAKHSPATRASFQIEQTASSDKRISLPRSVRLSHDLDVDAVISAIDHHSRPDKGKARAAMVPAPHDDAAARHFSRDLERGPQVADARSSTVSDPPAIGSTVSSSDSSIMGQDVPADGGEEWGPQHPCYPHLNPHVPPDSLEYANTRVIRIRRDWLLHGDLAPTFSNLYPEILDPAGMSEQEFRSIIDKLNSELVPIFSPWSMRNVVDGLLGLVTGWLWDDMGLTAVKSRLKTLDKWITQWNTDKQNAMAAEEGVMPPKIISLRQTAYMTLDIQIPDPEIAPVPSTAGADQSGVDAAGPAEPSGSITA
ncbi:hypothetical protein CDD82_567 [Ophiocordyceps australis]|uniref:Ras modification protein ERF4 n=1 Tax=Ophiocordyceps australis TaxID=1399860 RepID=A0A2C5YFX5_9HYPO|nr:hypothetical protein CDD82_567 [Ophiocordyceps australis]